MIAGNLDTWPQANSVRNGFVEFAYERRVGASPELRTARGRIFTLGQGFYFSRPVPAEEIAPRVKAGLALPPPRAVPPPEESVAG